MLPQFASLHQTESCTYELKLRCERNDMKRQIVGLALVLSVLSPLEVLAEFQLGEKIWPVALEDVDGQTIDLEPMIGKQPLLIMFWASW
ncbi:MAG: hypothetical protein CL923_03225 [Deltaproteobacteria bacterium]|nr:hypothetical protein [Deltaproteobacteria bacterium]